MSIADKLTAIAENEPRVYEAGKLALLRASKYMNATASGETVTVHDVSPVAHEMTVTDGDGAPAAVACYGANILDTAKAVAASNSTTIDGDVLTTTFTNKAAYVNIEWVNGKPVKFPAGTYTVTLVPVSDSGMVCTLYVYNNSGTVLFSRMMGADNGVYTYTFTATEEFRPTIGGYTPYGAHSYKIMLSVGDTAPDYEPYVEPTAHIGNVPSRHPCVTIMSQTDGVTLTCSYLRDVDTYIDSLKGGV